MKLLRALTCCTVLFVATPADADTTYSIDYNFYANAGVGGQMFMTGNLVLRDVIGPPTPSDVVSWNFTETNVVVRPATSQTQIASSVDGGVLTWTPGALSAGATLAFDFGPTYANELSFGPLWSFGPYGNQLGVVRGMAGQYFFGTFQGVNLGEYQTLGQIVAHAPSPLMGAGLPGILAAFAALWVLSQTQRRNFEWLIR